MLASAPTKRTRSTRTTPGRAGVVRRGAAEKANPWASLAPRPLSAEDMREIGENTTGLFALLAEWDRADKEPANRPESRQS